MSDVVNKKSRLSNFIEIPDNDPNEVMDENEEWVGMPEFSQEDLGAIRSIKINFETDRDVQEFAILLKQSITDKTRSVWYPRKDYIKPLDFVWHEE